MPDQGLTPRVLIGESFVAEGGAAAHVNTALGEREGRSAPPGRRS
jgi:formaldehyde-activating enzyme involved in methanogenesis